MAALISVPFQNNFEFNLGPNDDGFRYTLNFQPVIPLSISTDWNLIVRTIVPFIDQQDVFKGTAPIEEDIDGIPVDVSPGRLQYGLGDIVQSFFLSPKAPGFGGIIWGAGPVFIRQRPMTCLAARNGARAPRSWC